MIQHAARGKKRQRLPCKWQKMFSQLKMITRGTEKQEKLQDEKPEETDTAVQLLLSMSQM